MKRFVDPPDAIATEYGEAATIEYDIWGHPRFTFADPDSGEYFARVSD
jgi:hypothetical protein